MSESATSFLFIDSRVPDLDAVVAAAREGATIVVLDPAQDGVHQIARALEGHSDVASISIISHGDEGVLLLGSGALHAGNMAEHAADLQAIGTALAATGDVLLYGCDVGAGEQGAAFVAALAQVTGADVAASDDATGGAGRGDWDLEITTGSIEAAPVLEAADLAGYVHALVTQSVSTRAELQSAIDAGASDGQDDIITLLADVDFTSGSDTIAFYVTDGRTTTLVGGGHTIDAHDLGRVLAVHDGSVALDNITLTNGFVAGHGGSGAIYPEFASGGSGLGAGVWNSGTLTLTNSSIVDNKATAGGAGAMTGATTGTGTAGGGGGGGGIGSTPGGEGGESMGIGGSPGPGTPGTGGNGAGFDSHIPGGGGSIVGGVGGSLGGYSPGGAGGTASNGIISIGGGGGAAGYTHAGVSGGNAVAGIYNTGTLTILNSVISGNIAAGGGGSGGPANPWPAGSGGNGGLGVATIWNNGGTVVLDTTTAATMTSGNAAAGGFGGQALSTGGVAGTNGLAVSTSVHTSDGGATSIIAPPGTTIATIAFSADTGASRKDFVTKVAAQTLSGTTSANLAAGEVVEVSFDNGVTWSQATSEVGSNSWSITETLTGSGTLQVKVSNMAGSGSVKSQSYVLDSTAPDPLARPTLSPASDRGAFNSDAITNDATPTVRGAAEAGALVRLYDTDGTLLGAGRADLNGKWSITSDLLATGSHQLTAVSIDQAGNQGDPSTPLEIMIDRDRPTVRFVTSSNASGTYGTGDVIAIRVRFSEEVVVDGAPKLIMATGSGGTPATYVGGSGGKVLTFHYKVQAGDRTSDLDYVGVGALRLGTGSITDLAGNGVLPALPEPGAAGSLGAAKNIVVKGRPFTLSVAQDDGEVPLIGVAPELADGF